VPSVDIEVIELSPIGVGKEISQELQGKVIYSINNCSPDGYPDLELELNDNEVILNIKNINVMSGNEYSLFSFPGLNISIRKGERITLEGFIALVLLRYFYSLLYHRSQWDRKN
jgi:hypothetical protein